MFDPFDETWWRAGASLNWWDSEFAEPTGWMPDPDRALAWLRAHRTAAVCALALLRSYRTCETGQLHGLEPMLPAAPGAMLWRSMASLGLVDLGYPINVDGRGAWFGPNAPFTAVRIAQHHTIRGRLAPLGLTPMETASIGPGTLRAQRQYDRHNLITTGMAVSARSAGWLTAGEGWCQFSRITGDGEDGEGGPDLALMGETDLVFVEMTASMGLTLESKFRKWDRILDHPAAGRIHVVWPAGGRGRGAAEIVRRLDGLCADRPRQHAADAAEWTRTLACRDGFAPAPGRPRSPDRWGHRDMARLGAVYGMPAAGSWRLPERLSGRYWG